jgi:membrane protein
MPSFRERVTTRIAGVRERYPRVDHVVRTVQHYGNVNGNAQAGAVTFFGFLSFFPILALAFFVVGLVSRVYDASNDLEEAINTFLPGIVGEGEGEIPLSTFEENAATIGTIGLVGFLYSGLGWLSGMRNALEVVFETPKRQQPNFLVGKVRDLMSLAVIGIVLLVSVGLSGLISVFSEEVLDLIGLEGTPVTHVTAWLVVHALGVAATTLLLVVMFRLLVGPDLPRRSLVAGAFIGGIGFEVLKALASFLIGITKDQPAFQAFGLALILLVWIDYFSRVVMMSASWAYTSPEAIEHRAEAARRAPGAALHDRDRLDGGEARGTGLSPRPETTAVERRTIDDRMTEVGSPQGDPRRDSRGRGLLVGAALLAAAGGAVVLSRKRVGV